MRGLSATSSDWCRYAGVVPDHVQRMTTSGDRESDPPPGGGRERSATTPPRWTLAELLTGKREAIIEHDGVEYRLRLTANNKVILTK